MLKVIRLFSFLIYLISACSFGQIKEDESLLTRLMTTQPHHFRQFLLNPDAYEIQIIYTQVKRDEANQAKLKQFTYQLNPKTYFNPASLVKLPIALLALEKLNEMNIAGVNKFTRMGTGATFTCQTPIVGDNPKEQNFPCVARYIEQMFLVSDNDAYTRLYEFLGQGYIQEKLHQKGYADVHIIRRFTECDTLQNRHTNPIIFYDTNCKPIHYQNSQFNTIKPQNPLGIIKKEVVSVDYYNRKTVQILDNTHENFISLLALHEMMISIIMPEQVIPQKRFNLTDEDYQFLKRFLGAYPNEGVMTNYQLKDGYFDTYKKYLYYGRKEKANPNFRIYNIVGWWAGYLGDCAYFLDNKNQIEFFLSAIVYTHNGKAFDYEGVGFPFLANLGKLIYNYELYKK